MKRKTHITCYTLSILLTSVCQMGYSQNQPTAKEILTKMFYACTAATRFSSDLTKVERFDTEGKQRTTKLAIKAITQPTFKINIVVTHSDTFGESGSELIFPSKKDMACLNGWRSSIKGKYHNIYQDNVIRAKEKEHHTFSHIGFQYLIQILQYYQKKDSLKFYSALHIVEKQTFYEFTIDDFQYNESSLYQVTHSGETIVSIADALHVNQFKVWELNKAKKIDYLTPLKISEKLRVPSSYGRKTVLYIDKINFLPLTQIIYDGNTAVPYEKYIFEKFDSKPEKFGKDLFSYN